MWRERSVLFGMGSIRLNGTLPGILMPNSRNFTWKMRNVNSQGQPPEILTMTSYVDSYDKYLEEQGSLKRCMMA